MIFLQRLPGLGNTPLIHQSWGTMDDLTFFLLRPIQEFANRVTSKTDVTRFASEIGRVRIHRRRPSRTERLGWLSGLGSSLRFVWRRLLTVGLALTAIARKGRTNTNAIACFSAREPSAFVAVLLLATGAVGADETSKETDDELSDRVEQLESRVRLLEAEMAKYQSQETKTDKPDGPDEAANSVQRRELLVYRVATGDTVAGIAKKFAIPPAALRGMNGLADEDSLVVGQELRVPASVRAVKATPVPVPVARAESSLSKISRVVQSESQLHEVREGESLYTIAEKYGVSHLEIKHANSLKINLVQPGEHLVIPNSKTP